MRRRPLHRRRRSLRGPAALCLLASLAAVVLWAPRGESAVLLDTSFANSTTDVSLSPFSNGNGADQQPLPCLTGALIDQSSPTNVTISAAAVSGFSDQISTVGTSNPVTFSTLTSSPAVSVSSSGEVTVTSGTGDGTYTVSGDDTDGTLTGTWTYTLVVTGGTVPIQQTTPTAAVATVGSLSGFSAQLETSDTGTVTFDAPTTGTDLTVSQTGVVTAASTSLDVGAYYVSGPDSDSASGSGTYSFTLYVLAGSSSIENCDQSDPPADGSGSLELTDPGFYEASSVVGGSFDTTEGLDLSFDTHMYGGSPYGDGDINEYADGISFDLALPTPTSVGGDGGALAYTVGNGSNGMPAGYLGIGFDEYGNFGNPDYDGADCTDPAWASAGTTLPNAVTVRGPGNGDTGYCLLTSSADPASPGYAAMGPNGPIQLHGSDFASSDITVHIVISPTTQQNPTYLVTVQPVGAASATTVTQGPLPDSYYDSSGNLEQGYPSTLSYAVAGADGAGSDFHQITNLFVEQATLESITVTPADTSIASGGQQQYTATGNYSDGTEADITSQVTWGTGSGSVATITPGGLATGVGDGTTTVTATDGAIVGETNLTVGPVVSTTLSQPGPVPAGTGVYDTATVSGASNDTNGAITYGVYSDSACTDEVADLTPPSNAVTGGTAPQSLPYVFNSVGTYYFQASYTSDQVTTAVTSPCTSEPLTVVAATPTLSTTLSNPGPVTVGASVYDTATLAGATSTAGGTISYGVYSDSACTDEVANLTPSPDTVSDGAVPQSSSYVLSNAGTYYFQATYSGDSNNTGPVSSSCSSEEVTVNPVTVSLTTQLSVTSPVSIGTSVYDSATINNASANAGGTISYGVYSDSACTDELADLTPSPDSVNDGSAPPSIDYVVAAAGTYYFQATYSGDANNTGPVSSSCSSEELVVGKNSVTVTTALSHSSPVVAGTSVHDTATLVGATSSAGGTITYALYRDAACTEEVANLTPSSNTVVNGAAPASTSYGFPTAGTYYFQATYSGDANNTGPVSSSCTSEELVVNPPPTSHSPPPTTPPTTPPPTTPPTTPPPTTPPPTTPSKPAPTKTSTTPTPTETPVRTQTPVVATPAPAPHPAAVLLPVATVPVTHTAPQGPTVSLSQQNKSLVLSSSAVVPGESTTANGVGCLPGSTVTLAIAGKPVAVTTADSDGEFSAPITPPAQGVGRFTVTAVCGTTELATLLSVVAPVRVSTPEGGAAVFCVFLLLGAVLLRGQFTSNITRRRRRKRSAADLLRNQS